MQAALKLGITEAEYLEGERHSEIRHEYLAGEVRAVAGESKTHNTVSFRIRRLLDDKFSARPCETFGEGIKARIAAQTRYYYPDSVVTCDARDVSTEYDEYNVRYPSLIVEVLSPTTEHIDRGEKLAAYKTLPTLHAYLLVSQEEQRVELYRRGEGKLWLYQDFGPGELVEIPALEVALAVDDIYAGTRVGQVPEAAAE